MKIFSFYNVVLAGAIATIFATLKGIISLLGNMNLVEILMFINSFPVQAEQIIKTAFLG